MLTNIYVFTHIYISKANGATTILCSKIGVFLQFFGFFQKDKHKLCLYDSPLTLFLNYQKQRVKRDHKDQPMSTVFLSETLAPSIHFFFNTSGYKYTQNNLKRQGALSPILMNPSPIWYNNVKARVNQAWRIVFNACCFPLVQIMCQNAHKRILPISLIFVASHTKYIYTHSNTQHITQVYY